MHQSYGGSVVTITTTIRNEMRKRGFLYAFACEYLKINSIFLLELIVTWLGLPTIPLPRSLLLSPLLLHAARLGLATL